MLGKTKTYFNRVPWQSLRDLRNVGLLVFLVIVLLVSWSGIKAIQSNYNLQQQIAVLQQQNKLQQLKNQNQQLQNQYYKSNQYLELNARQNFGLGSPGETELIVPKNVALAQLAPNQTSTSLTEKATEHQSKYGQNFQAWLNFFLHRQNSSN